MFHNKFSGVVREIKTICTPTWAIATTAKASIEPLAIEQKSIASLSNTKKVSDKETEVLKTNSLTLSKPLEGTDFNCSDRPNNKKNKLSAGKKNIFEKNTNNIVKKHELKQIKVQINKQEYARYSLIAQSQNTTIEEEVRAFLKARFSFNKY